MIHHISYHITYQTVSNNQTKTMFGTAQQYASLCFQQIIKNEINQINDPEYDKKTKQKYREIAEKYDIPLTYKDHYDHLAGTVCNITDEMATKILWEYEGDMEQIAENIQDYDYETSKIDWANEILFLELELD